MHIVLIEPEIPQNTGSIARTCAATRTPLHLVGELGFKITEKAVRRAGLDYWPYVELHEYQTIEEFFESVNPPSAWYFTTHGETPYHTADFKEGDALIFGRETAGLGAEFLGKIPPEKKLLIPIDEPNVRSLNLSNAVSIALYEARRQISGN